MYEKMGSGRSSVASLELWSVEVIFWMPTTISRSLSGAKPKDMPLGMNRDSSYPPRVRLERIDVKPANR